MGFLGFSNFPMGFLCFSNFPIDFPMDFPHFPMRFQAGDGSNLRHGRQLGLAALAKHVPEADQFPLQIMLKEAIGRRKAPMFFEGNHVLLELLCLMCVPRNK